MNNDLLARLHQAEWERDIALHDLRDRDRWLRQIALMLNTKPDARLAEIVDSDGLLQRIVDGISQLQELAAAREEEA